MYGCDRMEKESIEKCASPQGYVITKENWKEFVNTGTMVVADYRFVTKEMKCENTKYWVDFSSLAAIVNMVEAKCLKKQFFARCKEYKSMEKDLDAPIEFPKWNCVCFQFEKYVE